jgi:phosphoribosylaminoimidazole-succinocarboxamide synthase
MISDEFLRNQILNTLERTDFNLGNKYEGKVRDNYLLEGKRIIITTDRVSAFDVVLGTIPFKGQALNQLSEFWFEKTKHIVPNHVLEVPDPNVMVVKECSSLPVEMVVRAYITGVTKTSAWYNYSQGVRNFCGNPLPEGLRKDQKLEKHILTPSTKAEKGEHDESVSKEEILKRGLISEEDFDKMAEISFRLFSLGSEIVSNQGMILVDTKYEFGKDQDGNIVLIDEIHTPDSSRFWYSSAYEENFQAGREQRKIDKEYVRKWYADQGFTGDGSPPQMTDLVKIEAAKRYIEAYEKITGRMFIPKKDDVLERIKRNLGI